MMNTGIYALTLPNIHRIKYYKFIIHYSRFNEVSTELTKLYHNNQCRYQCEISTQQNVWTWQVDNILSSFHRVFRPGASWVEIIKPHNIATNSPTWADSIFLITEVLSHSGPRGSAATDTVWLYNYTILTRLPNIQLLLWHCWSKHKAEFHEKIKWYFQIFDPAKNHRRYLSSYTSKSPISILLSSQMTTLLFSDFKLNFSY